MADAIDLESIEIIVRVQVPLTAPITIEGESSALNRS